MQAGVTDTKLKEVQEAGKAIHETEKTLDLIEKQSGDAFKEAIEAQASVIETKVDLVDVTHSAIETKRVGCPMLPKTSIRVYQGILANLLALGKEGSAGRLYAVLAGDGSHVIDVITNEDMSTLEPCILSDAVQSRWTNLNISPMGLVAWAEEDQQDIQRYVPYLECLKSSFKTLLMVFMNGGADPVFWEVSPKSDGASTQRCSGVNARSGRKKGHEYRVVAFTALGKANVEAIGDAVSRIVTDDFKGKLSKQFKADAAQEEHFERFYVPADGWCFWHAILAALSFDTWSALPRHSSGYATNSRTVKLETERAKALAARTMDSAMELGIDPARLAEIKHNGVVGVDELQWICAAMELNVRRYIEEEVGVINIGKNSALYIEHIYIYVYTVAASIAG